MKIKSIINHTKIKIVVMVSAVLWILVFSQAALSMVSEKRVSIKEAFAIGDEISAGKCTNEIVSKIDGININEAEKETFETAAAVLAKKIMESNGCEDYYAGFNGKKNDKNTTSYEVVGNDKNYIIKIIITKLQNSDDIYLHYYVESKTYSANTPDECYKRSSAVLNLLDALKAQSIIYTRIDGSVKGRMSENECRRHTDEIYNRLRAKKVSEHYEGDYTSYGYANKLGETIVSEGEKINIHVRYSYNELEDKTEVVIATPLITD